MAVAHRTGTVLVGEASVVIAVSSAHRRDALEVRHMFLCAANLNVPHCMYRIFWHLHFLAPPGMQYCLLLLCEFLCASIQDCGLATAYPPYLAVVACH